MPTVVFEGGSVGKHLAAGENGKVPFLRWDAAALCYLGSLCVSPDDVNV